MSIITAIFLGAIQGLTEFLPVSSSGHLALANNLLNIPQGTIFFEVVLHLGTLFAIMLFMQKKIVSLVIDGIKEFLDKSNKEKKNFKYMVYIIIGIIPAVIFALFFDKIIESSFSNIRFIGLFFLITSILLYSTKFFSGNSDVNLKNSLWVGIAQIIALFPGISRSGTTISAGIIFGIDKEKACDFSFFMALPLIFGAFLKEIVSCKPVFEMNFVYGFISSFIFGYISVVFLYKILKSNKFYYFSYYLVFIGAFTIVRSFI